MPSRFRAVFVSALWVFTAGCQDTTDAPRPDATAADAAPVDADIPDVMSPLDGAPDVPDPEPEPEPDAAPDPEPDAALDAAIGPRPCDPPLAIEPAEAWSAAFDLVVLTPTGGTGNHRFELVENNSGAIVNALTGAYLAGGVEEVDDRIRLTDTACIGEATATVHVTRPLEVRPSLVSVATRQTLQFDVVGGSGSGQYRLSINNTQGNITREGFYTAGPRLGRDVVVVTDPGTGLEAEAVVSVVEDPTLAADPPFLFLPLGAEMPVDFIGGSGWFDITRDARTATFDQATRTFHATSPGRTRFDLQDQYTPQEVTITVDVAEPLQAPLGRAGRALDAAVFHAPGDLDRDGYPDAILGHPEPSVEAFSDGAVFLYRGGPQGLRSAPAQVFNGRARDDQLGRAVTTADIDRDGQVDLIIGAWLDDTGGADRGAVTIHPGLPDGTFGDEPLITLNGVRNGDNFGRAIVPCDFNGDGLVDLAITASAYENTGGEYEAGNQGAVLVFLGSEAGYRLTADGGILPGGALNAEGIWQGAANLGFGAALAAGDIDGDGICDLAAAAPTAQGNAGVIHVYRGRAPSGDDGGLNAVPNRVYVGTAGNTLGAALAIADLNGDRRADIIATEPGFDAAGAANAGAVRIFSGGPLAGPVRQNTPVSEANWTWPGQSANQTVGTGLAVADQTGDRLVDIVVGSRNAESPAEGAPVDTGSITVLPGQIDDWPSTAPALTAYGLARGDQFGDTLAILGDVDGDGVIDIGTVASRDDTLGINVGRPYFVSGADGRTRALDLPGAPAGAQNGFAIAAVGDIDRDGLSDLVVGAPNTPLADQLAAGAAYLYRGTETGYSREPTLTFTGHPGHGQNDRFGYDITGGDFDGDGIRDIFISALAEQRDPNLPADTYAIDGNCPRFGNQGAVYIYRGGAPIDPARPAFIYYGPANNANLARIGALDINDDGRDDLIVGGGVNGSFNGFQIVYGRLPAPDGRIRLLCDPAYTFNPRVGNTAIGQSIALLGDLDFDGCNDFAIGAPRETVDRTPAEGDTTNQAGTVRVIFGWNQAGCAPRERTVVIAGDVAQGQLGHAVAAGNVTGGPEIDLVIGAPNSTNDGNVRTGAVFVVDGAYLTALPTEPPDRLLPAIFPVAPDGAERVRLLGTEANEAFGRSVAVVGGRVIAGRLAGRVGDRTNIGGAQIYGFRPTGLPYRAAAIAGETWRQQSLIGEALAFDRSRTFIAIGGYQASGLATDAGAVYVYNLAGIR